MKFFTPLIYCGFLKYKFRFMKKKAFFFALLFIWLNQNGFAQLARPPKPIPDQYIVVLKETSAKPVIKQQKKNDDREQKFKDNDEAMQNNLKKLHELKSKKNIREENVKSNIQM